MLLDRHAWPPLSPANSALLKDLGTACLPAYSARKHSMLSSVIPWTRQKLNRNKSYELINMAVLFTTMCVACISLAPIYVIQIPSF